MRTAAAHLDPPRSDGVRHPFRGLLHAGVGLGRWYVRRRYDVRVHHADRFPRSGPVVVAANHIGYADGPLLAMFTPRPVHALTKVEMFDGRMGLFLRAAGQIPIDRFDADPRAVRTALRVLREGRVVGVFPEGRRGAGDLDRFHRGAAYLAMVVGAPVVPLIFLGTREPGGHTDSLPPRGARIDMWFGRPVPMVAEPWPRTRYRVTTLSLLLHDRMREDLRDALAETGGSLPGPLPPGQTEPDSEDDVTEERPA